MEERNKRGKRVKRYRYQKKQTILKVIRYMIGYMIIGILGYMAYGFYIEAKVRTVAEGENANLAIVQKDTELQDKANISSQKESKEFTKVTTKYAGYDVDCRLEVPRIKLNTNVLADYSKAGLKVCVSKYYGPNANEIGNYCIAGHNYNKENMFNHLIDLKIGDSLFLTDNANGKVEYTIYDMYRVKPENVEPLSQETRGEKEVTLITCVNYSSRRLVVKAICTKGTEFLVHK